MGTNKFCAAETVQSFLLDGIVPSKSGIPPHLPETHLTREQMEKIETNEKVNGRYTSVDQMLKDLQK